MTKTLIAAVGFISTGVFAAGAAADSVYYGLANGNPDLIAPQGTMNSVVAAQPGVGDNFDRYHGLDEGNGDLFGTPRTSGDQPFSSNPNISGGFRGSPSLSY